MFDNLVLTFGVNLNTYVEKLYPWVGLSKIRFRCFIAFVVHTTFNVKLKLLLWQFFSHKWNETLDFYLYFFCFYAFSSPSSHTKACFFGLLSSQTHSVKKPKIYFLEISWNRIWYCIIWLLSENDDFTEFLLNNSFLSKIPTFPHCGTATS